MSGISVDAWVKLEGGCRVSVDIVGDEAQIRFGAVRSDGIDLIATEEGLEQLVETSAAALAELRAKLDEYEKAEAAAESPAA
ncbi:MULTISPECIES: hypothetical protein [Actinoalloteichus]|uniref:Uncharacterized protein n=1 Tax=Actinoalloteichus fjordicus TaxID=1612552 RepID=A0AAC9LIJ1_9PSEU|nr:MULTISPECIES: hypothetical protein [Actinoalloteichus]APU16964.1 hypothetical protein UA74_24750 [Actinoalloteichus fjordicus]APU23044.1 hypothetical protein UA75_25330 [Actinoalloteichus sp. GBA129-24]